MDNKKLREKAERYVIDNNITSCTYTVEKAFIDGAKMSLEVVKSNSVLGGVIKCDGCNDLSTACNECKDGYYKWKRPTFWRYGC